MAPTHFVGVDGGTESIRAGVFTLQGVPLAFSSCAYATTYPHPGWAEQNPADWWQAMGTAVKTAVASSSVPVSSIAGICVDTTCCTVVALDESGDALRPALLWMDMRSADQAAQVSACGDEALQVNSAGNGPVSAEWMIPKSLWMKQNEPELFESARYVCEYQDYINFKMTGRMCASINNASVRWHYSSSKGWPTSMLQKLGLSELQAKWPQEVLPLGAKVGGLTAAAASHLGLAPGTLVAQGGADAFIGLIGLGVVQPGQLGILTGSSHLQLGMVDKEVHAQGIFGTYQDAVLPGVHVIEGGQTSTGSIINWMSKELLAGSVSYDVLNKEAAAVPPGCEGLLALDHFQGNRTPHTDPLSRGAITGLTLKHSRAHVYRSLIESVCYGTGVILDTMAAAGYKPSTITMAGGSARSDLWLQIHADVCNLPITITKVVDAPALGCAILAAVAAGHYPDVPTAAKAMVQVKRVVQPDAAVHKQYKPYYERYQQLYTALAPLYHAAAGKVPPAAPAPAPAANDSHSGPRSIISPSILASDFANLASEVARVQQGGADWVHVDMFDGSMVANFTIGPPVLKSLRQHSSMFMDCHLAVNEPEKYIEAVAEAGGDQASFHIEVMASLQAAIELAGKIRALGMRAGVALAPETGIEQVSELVAGGHVDLVLCMTVTPGFGGQKFQPQVMDKVKALREQFPEVDIMCDGGVNPETVKLCAAAGANAVVAGTAVFCSKDGPAAAIAQIRAPLLERFGA